VIDVEQAAHYDVDHHPHQQERTMPSSKRPTAHKVASVRQRAEAAQTKANEAARDLARIERDQTEARIKKIAAVLVRMSDRLNETDKQRIRRAIGDVDSVRINSPRYRRPGTTDKWSGSTHGARAKAAKAQFEAWNKSAEGKTWWKSPQGRAQRAAEPGEIYPMIAFVRLSEDEAQAIIVEHNDG
jgi:hypothetical protein